MINRISSAKTAEIEMINKNHLKDVKSKMKQNIVYYQRKANKLAFKY